MVCQDRYPPDDRLHCVCSILFCLSRVAMKSSDVHHLVLCHKILSGLSLLEECSPSQSQKHNFYQREIGLRHKEECANLFIYIKPVYDKQRIILLLLNCDPNDSWILFSNASYIMPNYWLIFSTEVLEDICCQSEIFINYHYNDNVYLHLWN